jgi:probable F420-dependent oxidoreductase
MKVAPKIPEIGVFVPVGDVVTADPAWMANFAGHLELCGVESIIVAEHTVLASSYDSVYPYDSSGRVGVAADGPIPDPLAKRAATVDVLSGGRLRLCVGAGWLKEEVEACGVEFDNRGRRADEQITVLRALWDDQPQGASYHGNFFNFDKAMSYPKQIAGERLPIHIGGHSRTAARRAGRFGDGFRPLGVSGPQLASLITLMRAEASTAGRDPAAPEVLLGHLVTKIDAERAAGLVDQGADRIVLAVPPTSDIEQAKDILSACAQRLSLAS